MGKGSKRLRTVNNKAKRVPKGSMILAEPLSAITPEADSPYEALASEHQTSLELVYGKSGLPEGVTPIVEILLLPEPKAHRRVTMIRDHTLDFPDLYLDVYVAGDPAVGNDEARFAQMFARAHCKKANSPLEADLVVFGGGSDVDPVLYGKDRHDTTYPSRKRDEDDMILYKQCLDAGIPMFGVCRGAQFLHVMNGGELFQDVDGHYGDHPMHDISTQTRIDKVSSVHHQMVKNNKAGGMEVIGVSNKSNKRWSAPREYEAGTNVDIEAFFYRDTCAIGIQGHPEYAGYPFFTKWCLDLINELVIMNPDITWVGDVPKHRRIDPDLLKQRASIMIAPIPVQEIN